jgi:AcrR family transcriptional regulator
MARPIASSIRVETTERVLRAAEHHFAVQGFDAARLADIAAEAGITRASLLYHFDEKERLYAQVVQRAFASLGEIITSALQTDGPFAPRLRAVVEGFLVYVDQHPHLARIIVREVIESRGPGRTALLEHGVPLIDAVVRFVEDEGAGALRTGVPVRGALLQVITNAFLRSAAGDLRAPLWGASDETWRLASALLLKETA